MAHKYFVMPRDLASMGEAKVLDISEKVREYAEKFRKQTEEHFERLRKMRLEILEAAQTYVLD